MLSHQCSVLVRTPRALESHRMTVPSCFCFWRPLKTFHDCLFLTAHMKSLLWGELRSRFSLMVLINNLSFATLVFSLRSVFAKGPHTYCAPGDLRLCPFLEPLPLILLVTWVPQVSRGVSSMEGNYSHHQLPSAPRWHWKTLYLQLLVSSEH